MQFTTVLVHGAFEESAAWASVVSALLGRDHRVIAPTDPGHRVIAVANPLRGLASDAAAVTDVVRTIDGPVVLVGHGYGGAVISNVDRDAADLRGLVYAAAFAPEAGETCVALEQRFPGSTLAEAIHAVHRSSGDTDLYIGREAFHGQACADLSTSVAALMAETQRPIAAAALAERSCDRPLWRDLPSWFIFGDQDRSMPLALHRELAERAGAQRTIEVQGASHAIAAAHPNPTAQLILEAVGLIAAA